MNTTFLLMAEFDSSMIPLSKIKDRFFGIEKDAEANRRARDHKLPVPAFRMGSQRSGYFVRAEDLAEYIDKIATEQRETWKKINAA